MNKKRRKKGARGGCWCDGMETDVYIVSTQTELTIKKATWLGGKLRYLTSFLCMVEICIDSLS